MNKMYLVSYTNLGKTFKKVWFDLEKAKKFAGEMKSYKCKNVKICAYNVTFDFEI